MKRLVAYGLGGAALLTLLMISAIPANAGLDVKIEMKTVPADSAVIRGAVPLTIDAQASSYLRSFKVWLEPRDSNVSTPPPLLDRSFTTGQAQTFSFDSNWDSYSVTPTNAVFTLKVQVSNQVGETVEQWVTNITVDNLPLAPLGVKSRLEGNTPIISWANSTEPDFRGYEVFRSEGGRSYRLIAKTQLASYKDVNAPRGFALRYTILSKRNSLVASDHLNYSAPSVATAPLTIKIPSASPQTSPQPLVIAAEAQPQASPVRLDAHMQIVQGRRRDVGFEQTLPYEQVPSLETVGAPQVNAPMTVASPDFSFSEQPSKKLPFAAAAYLMIFAAVHLIRFATALSRS